MPSARTRTLRGALAGALAAGVWAAQQPLDKKAFGVDYDDCELLGTVVTRGRWAYPIGVASHLVNGAIFGAIYSRVAPSVPAPAPARGIAAGLAEHLVTWPSLRFISLHPDARRFPPLWGSRAAFAQATWRHALFGAVLGTVEGRLNPPAEPPPAEPDTEPAASTNGHGDVHRLTVVGKA
jgi:hypothetical protein